MPCTARIERPPSIEMIPLSSLVFLSWKGTHVGLVRPSNEATDNPSKLARSLFRDGG